MIHGVKSTMVKTCYEQSKRRLIDPEEKRKEREEEKACNAGDKTIDLNMVQQMVINIQMSDNYDLSSLPHNHISTLPAINNSFRWRFIVASLSPSLSASLKNFARTFSITSIAF